MKKIIISLLLLTGLSATTVKAQMAQAQTVTWDVSRDTEVNIDHWRMWKILDNADSLTTVSNGYVTSIQPVNPAIPRTRKVTFANGNTRVENIVQNEPHNKLLVMEMADTALPKGIKSVRIAIFLKAKDDGSSVMWKAMIDGGRNEKKALAQQLTAEFDSYIAGFKKLAGE